MAHTGANVNVLGKVKEITEVFWNKAFTRDVSNSIFFYVKIPNYYKIILVQAV